MKIELEIPEGVQFDRLCAPWVLGGPAFRHLPADHPSRPWMVELTSLKSMTPFWTRGFGMTPQAAVNDGVRLIEEHINKFPNGTYKVGNDLDLDLSGLADI